VTQHFSDIGQSAEVHDVTYENAQARERTQVLMDKTNQLSGIVIGTGDLSELALGWATYNGNHMRYRLINIKADSKREKTMPGSAGHFVVHSRGINHSLNENRQFLSNSRIYDAFVLRKKYRTVLNSIESVANWW
jgi:hypothetical protein